ncbi:MAG: hypothetical protein H6737_30515 [Alphaproteobacteria bacterium]|nr:hypothetical protein [Alphaproteobacteria bacterium]
MMMLVSSLLVPAWAGVPVTVEVLDESDAPVTTATIEVDGEGEAHRVHGETALWTATGIVPPDQVEQPFEKGQLMKIQVRAEGFDPASLAYVIRKKKNHVRVILHQESNE